MSDKYEVKYHMQNFFTEDQLKAINENIQHNIRAEFEIWSKAKSKELNAHWDKQIKRAFDEVKENKKMQESSI